MKAKTSSSVDKENYKESLKEEPTDVEYEEKVKRFGYKKEEISNGKLFFLIFASIGIGGFQVNKS